MTQQEQVVRPKPPRVLRNAMVSKICQVTPGTLRVSLTGPDLDGFEMAGPAAHVRLWFPQPGYSRPVMPAWTEKGPVMPAGYDRPASRVYTPRRFDPLTCEIDIDFVLHGDATAGPGAAWVNAALPGDWVVVAGPGGAYQPDPDAATFVIAGDHTALPAIATVVEALPASAHARVYVEVPDSREEQPLCSDARLYVAWLHGGYDSSPGRLLARTLREEPPSQNDRVFVACEADLVREIRRDLIGTRGLAPERVYTHAYWKRGVANHPDHDLAEDA